MALARLTKEISQRNFLAYLWHALFLALAQNFMDVDTIVPAMITDAGGTSLHIGILTAIMVGGSAFMQLVFSPYLNNRPAKKRYLLMGIALRIMALLGLGALLFLLARQQGTGHVLTLVFLLITVFSLGGSFAAISYTDILGKSLLPEKRKAFFSLRQALMSIGVFISALLAARLLQAYAYPYNYAALFFTAGLALTIAAGGFWQVQEVGATIRPIADLRTYWQRLRVEINDNPRLRGYLLLVNTLGISLSLLPFLLYYGKQQFGINNIVVGQYLIFKVSAGVIAGLLLFYFRGRIRYKQMLYVIAAISIVVPLHLLIQRNPAAFRWYFFAGGLVFTLYKVAMEGILLEVSSNQNRALYAGLAGAGNLVPALFPIAAGWLIGHYGFTPFFVVFLVTILLAVWLIYRLACEK